MLVGYMENFDADVLSYVVPGY